MTSVSAFFPAAGNIRCSFCFGNIFCTEDTSFSSLSCHDIPFTHLSAFLLFSFLFFWRCQPWARSPFLPEWGFTLTAGRRWAHFGGGNETTALSLSVRSFHSALARQTLAQGLAWKKWPEIDGIYSFPGLAERSGKNIPESVTEILQSSISGAAISCGRRKMGSTRSHMENKHTGASCQIQLIL